MGTQLSTRACNRYGRASELVVTAERTPRGTTLGPVRATAPFRIMKAFKPERYHGYASLMTMSSSAGLMAGDEQRIRVTVGGDASLAMSAQAFEKVHRMDDGEATRTTEIVVAHGGALSYIQQPVIPFAGSRFTGTTTISLADATATLAYGEVIACGRVARGERFQFAHYENRVRIDVAGHLLYRDTMVFDPTVDNLEGIGGFEGFSHLASLVIVAPGADDTLVDDMRTACVELNDSSIAGGVTYLGTVGGAHAIAARLLGHRAQNMLRCIAHMIDVAGFPIARGVAL